MDQTADTKKPEDKTPDATPPVAGTPPTPDNLKPETANDDGTQSKEAAALLSSLLAPAAPAGSPTAPVVPPEAPQPSEEKTETVMIPPTEGGQPPKKRRGGKAVAIVTILILLITIPVGVYYYFQQRQRVYEESQAADEYICIESFNCDVSGGTCFNCGSYNLYRTTNGGECCVRSGAGVTPPPGVYPPTSTPPAGPTPTWYYPYRACAPDGTGYSIAAHDDCNNGDGDPRSSADPYGRGFGCTDTAPAGTIMAHFVCDGLESDTTSGGPGVGGQGCGYTNGTKIWEGSGTRNFVRDCGLEQIDTVDGTISIRHCLPCGDSPPPPPPPPGSSPTPTPTPPMSTISPSVTPTVTPTPAQCISLKAYNESGQQVNPAALRPGDRVTFGVVAGPASKARFRISNDPDNPGYVFRESTASRTTGGVKEYVWPADGSFFTVPQPVTTTTYTVEAEIFADGVWK